MVEKRVIANNLVVYSISHALVDLICAGALFTIYFNKLVNPQVLFVLVIVYNVLAFAFQAPFGLWIDKLRKPVFSAVFGSILVILSPMFIFISPLTAVILAGVGNAFFHIGGGIISLNLQPKKATMPGIFVAPGALGLAIGIYLGKAGIFYPGYFILALGAMCILMLKIKMPLLEYNKKKIEGDFRYFELIIILLLFSISIRAFIGFATVFPWKSNLLLLALLTFAVVLGKGLGGFFGDKFGWVKVSVTALLLSAPLIYFGKESVFLGILGMFLFNMTMPVTLVGVSNMLHGRFGFAFGLTTLALIIGVYPTYFDVHKYFSSGLLFFIIILSALTLFIGLKLYFKKFPEMHYKE
ncbi:hypothetical protein A3K73_03130 [Candidatus Pacearchaeota archaeon RBG_13_36_9]|nr:MAG: hypothetical protein A3K73_03130 [Candidatus Pacearchaeota archaeon RBG_13_36_9]HJX50954.1 hypothetical protein [Candidatus Nanoarchaeia archaeon]